MNLVRPLHALMNAGQAEASLFHRHQVARCLQDMGIDVRAPEALELRHVVREDIQVDHHHPDGQSHLRCRQSHAVGAVHGLVHVAEQLFQVRVVGGDVFGILAQHRLAIHINR